MIHRGLVKNLSVLCVVMMAMLLFIWYGPGKIRSVYWRDIEEIRTKQQELEKQLEFLPKTSSIVPCGQMQVVSSTQLWRPIQEQVHNTVVQIYVQIAATDILQPYKTPAQGSAYGSGFFINQDGYLVTNAHVVMQAKAIWIQIPGMGKQIIDVDVVGISPDRDLALLKVTSESLELIRAQLGQVPFLPLGDSDALLRSDEVLALGYPLGQHALKSTTGVISGRERHLIQMSAAINPGSSGGPLLNCAGQVVGVNSSGVVEAQNVGYAIPINDLKLILPDLYTTKILPKPYLGVLFNNASIALTQYLGNPLPGGCYVAAVLQNSPLDKAGVQQADMLYEINGYRVDIFGEMKVPWSEDKISIVDFVGHLATGQDIDLVIYRLGVRKEIKTKFDIFALPAIHKIYPGYESVDYEVFGGLVMMELTMNHIQALIEQAPGLARYAEIKNQHEPVLVITHIFPNSQGYRSRALLPGMTIAEINGEPVKTLQEYRAVVRKGLSEKYLTIKAIDNITRASDNTFVVLEYDKILQEEEKFAGDYRYPLSKIVKDYLIAQRANANLVE